MRMKITLFAALILSGFVASTAVAQNLSKAEQEQIMEVQDRIVQPQAQSLLVPPPEPMGAVAYVTDPRTGAPVQISGPIAGRFNLTFRGGTPAEFIESINKQAGMRVNVIIPPEFAEEQIPPLEVYDVTLPQLFESVSTAGPKISTTDRRFTTFDFPPSENSIWRFYASTPPAASEPPAVVRVYQLSNLLSSYTIEDITTAIKTTWQMLDSKTKPEMKFHEETKLLVAKGTEEQLRMIETVTDQLGRGIIEKERVSNGFPRPPAIPSANPNP